MSYRRVSKSYRRSIARRYRQLEEQPRARLAAIGVLMVAVLGLGAGLVIATNFHTTLSTASNSTSLTNACDTSTSPVTTAAPSTPAASAAAAAARRRYWRRHHRPVAPTPTPTTTMSSPVVTPTPTTAPTTAPVTTPAPTGTPAPTMSVAPPTTTTSVAPTTTASVSPTSTASVTPTSTASVTPTATATASPTTSTSVSATPTPCPSTSTTPPVTTANVACDIIVPANPLSAAGLATPYQLTGTGGMSPAASGCNMANAANLGAFVQATILDPATGALSVYEPLVITQGTTPAAAPVVPTLPANAVVTIDFGFNGTDLTQVGATPTALQQGNCVDGLNGSIFGQVSFCNGTTFFQAAARAKAQGMLTVPALGTSSKNGQACLTTRSFDVIDQDPSDNVTTDYLLTASGQTAQLNAANSAALPGATDLANGSDNKLLSAFLNPTLGCASFMAPDLSQDGTPGTSQALNELAAAADQTAPVALVPENDEMVLVNNAFSVAKTNLYRSEIGQPAVAASNDTSSSPANFCQNMVNVQTPFLNADQTLLATGASPVPAVGNNLLTFLANRLSMSFTNLNCQDFGLTNPVTVTLDGNGVATAATFNTAQQTATGAGGAAPPAPGQRRGRGHHKLMNPSGM
jgi:hypothetical protein